MLGYNGHNARSMRENTVREYRQRYGIVLVYREDTRLWYRVDVRQPWLAPGPLPLSKGHARAEDAASEIGGVCYAVAR